MLANLRIHWKLSLLSAVFLAPIALLTWLLVDQASKDVTFAAKELEGTRYITALREMLVPLVLGDGVTAAARLPAVQEVNAAVGGGMDLGETLAPVEHAVTAARRVKGATGSDGIMAAMDATMTLLGRVGDGSNLILDPDLDSYYTMDMVVVRLPEALHEATHLLMATQALLAQTRPSLREVADLQTHLGSYNETLNGLDTDLERATRGNPDGSLRQTLAPAVARFQEAARAFSKSMNGFAEGAMVGTSPAQGTAALMAKLHADTGAQGDKTWATATTDLERLLNARIRGLRQKLAISLGITAAVLVLAGILAVLIARSISRPVAQLVKCMGVMASGDLSRDVPGRDRGDEPGVLARAAGEMQGQLHGMATEVRTYARGAHGAAQEIARAVDQQAAASAEMSASVAEITSTMEELSASSTQIAEYSKSVVDIATLAWEHSKKGSEAVQQALVRMDGILQDNQRSLGEILELGNKSKEISRVMEIINAVADQTRLIAFNAALEAAGAGESGRRFGVVAGEIRRLADSVTESTGEIERKISHIQDSISVLVLTSEKGSSSIASGRAATAHTAERLNEIVEAARQTSGAAQQISLSTQQQKTASSQVVVALREIVTASSATAQSIARISEISRQMTQLSAELDFLVGRFRLSATDPAPTAGTTGTAGPVRGPNQHA